VALKFCRYLIDAWQQRKKVRLERIRVPALVFDYPRHSGATDKGMIKRVLIFGLYSFWPRSKLVGGKIKAHRGAAHKAETWYALQELEGEDLVVFLLI
jgi:hypothetical protein